MRDHTKLEAFQLADQLVLGVYSATRGFPDDEKFGLTSQMRRAAVSVGANIVEGSARSAEGDYVRFLSIAYASAKELQYEISIAARLGYFSQLSSDSIAQLASKTSKALWALIHALQSNRSNRLR